MQKSLSTIAIADLSRLDAQWGLESVFSTGPGVVASMGGTCRAAVRQVSDNYVCLFLMRL